MSNCEPSPLVIAVRVYPDTKEVELDVDKKKKKRKNSRNVISSGIQRSTSISSVTQIRILSIQSARLRCRKSR